MCHGEGLEMAKVPYHRCHGTSCSPRKRRLKRLLAIIQYITQARILQQDIPIPTIMPMDSLSGGSIFSPNNAVILQ